MPKAGMHIPGLGSNCTSTVLMSTDTKSSIHTTQSNPAIYKKNNGDLRKKTGLIFEIQLIQIIVLAD
jgi:hypothetical protein